MSRSPAPSVFLSFAEEDRAIADRVRLRLERDGVDVWMYTESRESGHWHENQLLALRASKVAVFIVTELSAASAACLDEAKRAVHPSSEVIAVPLVVGAWKHESTKTWLYLGHSNGVVASTGVDDDALRRLTEIVHDSLGSRPVSSLSTGQALSAVKDDLCEWLEERDAVSPAEVLDKARQLQIEHRGNMVSFAQFTHLDRELDAADLLEPTERRTYLARFLRSYFERVVSNGHEVVSQRLAQRLDDGDVVVITEYSRVIVRALKIVQAADPTRFRSLTFLVVKRPGMLLVNDEPTRMAQELRALGSEPEMVEFHHWVEYLVHGTRLERVNKLLFGVEAFSEGGDVVYPQIVKELDVLRTRRMLASPIADATIIAAGESFKVCRDRREVSKMIADPHYTVMGSECFDVVLTDTCEVEVGPTGRADLTSCVEFVAAGVDEIRRLLWPGGTPLPIWNLPSSVASGATVLVSDIDGSITHGSRIALAALQRFEQFAARGVQVVLTTGRSAGWACAISHYLPGVAAVIAENGAVLIDPTSTDARTILLDAWDESELPDRMRRVEECLARLRERYPDLRLSADNFTRITDRTIEVAEGIEHDVVSQLAAEHGLRWTSSSVHHHLSVSDLDKGSGLRRALTGPLGLDHIDLQQSVVTLGDSLNDAPLFDQNAFAATVGVRSVLAHKGQLAGQAPGYVTLHDASAGFLELADQLLASRPLN